MIQELKVRADIYGTRLFDARIETKFLDKLRSVNLFNRDYQK
jgi:hypothetical protein